MIRRLLMRRGIYTGVYTGWLPSGDNYPPRPALYLVINHKAASMVRFEAGIGRFSIWLDWGHGAR